ncbi:ESX secretion-associated protein EspG [Saccharopolyspora sp. TS4A08]|uniref:ESX secretion-associated protein EspG n=1 Tax=Saccharopolyspora ipomoeae TaxID=3042027 RepID=A0ABT6PSP6_9PSEU|nr:ESX secretion-associated protein EspG [Saccharopolyspora sp. TS4A08]MDI2031038.1 ESX secretion-associated protein EspG [Saccharopolyspora sp. TS4A08]
MTAATTRPKREGIDFGQVELDLLAAHAGVTWPFPLRIPSFGRIAGERETLFAAAGHTLRLRGLADDDGPAGAATELVTALRQYRGTVDLVLVDETGASAVLAMLYRSSVLVFEQRLDGDPATTVRIRRVAPKALVDELVALVPEHPPAKSMPINLPHRVVDDVAALNEIDDDRLKQRRFRELVRDCGGDPGALDRLVAVLPALTGRGQLGATRRTSRGDERRGAELSWLDGPHGRLRVNRTDGGWVSLNPLRPAVVRAALTDLVSTAREPR